jgi:hypothetical protein
MGMSPQGMGMTNFGMGSLPQNGGWMDGQGQPGVYADPSISGWDNSGMEGMMMGNMMGMGGMGPWGGNAGGGTGGGYEGY